MIYCVEDDVNIRELLVYTLKSTGFEAKGFEDAKSLYLALEDELPKLILLDIMLPNEDGIEILKKLKKSNKTSQISVIMLTAKNSEYDKVLGLDLGADDYITKPFGVMELVSRIKAVLRRSKGLKKDEEILKCGSILLNKTKHQLLVGEDEVVLTLKEFELLIFLMENENKVLSRNMLIEKIWGYDFIGESRTLDVHIRTLRQKLGDEGERIETIRGLGYKIRG